MPDAEERVQEEEKPIFGLVALTTLGRVDGSNEDSRELVRFVEQWLDELSAEDLAVRDELKPECSFIGFFQTNPQLGCELGFGASSASRSVVGADRGGATDDLLPDRSALGRLRKSIDQSHNSQGKLFRSFAKITFGHGLSPPPVPLTGA
jgi:hypothetical protein